MITQTLTQQIGEAMKAKDAVRLSTLRMLSSEFNYEKIKLQHDLSEAEELVVVRREAKKRKEAVEAFKSAGANDRAEMESAELAVLQQFLPPDLSAEEIEKLVAQAITETSATSMADMGRVIGLVKSKNPNVDGSVVAQLVKQKLTV